MVPVRGPTNKSSVREERQPARDEAEEVAPGVLRIQLPIALPGLGHVNCYALEDDKGVALVDPGLPGPATWRQLKRRLDEAGLPIDRVHTVVVTHSHPDHFGQAGRLRKRNGARIVTHRSFRTYLDPAAENDDEETVAVFQPDPGHHHGPDDHGPDHHGHQPGDDGGPGNGADGEAAPEQPRRASVTPEPNEFTPFSAATPWGGPGRQVPLARRLKYLATRYAAGRFMATPSPTDRVEDAEVLRLGGREWISVHTPGHTRDHLCLWDPAAGVLMSGDHVLPTITPHISGLGATIDPLADFFTSLERMETFDGVSAVLPAHGLVFDDLAGRARSIREHHHQRLDTLLESGDELGRATVEDYMRQLFQSRSWGPMAASETYAHLEHLRLTGRALVSSDGHQLRYEMRG